MISTPNINHTGAPVKKSLAMSARSYKPREFRIDSAHGNYVVISLFKLMGH